MKLNWNLSSFPAAAQLRTPAAVADAGRPQRLRLAATRLWRGDRRYLRALRAAEMAAWETGRRWTLLLLGSLLLLGTSTRAVERQSFWQTDADGLWADASHWNSSSYPDNVETNLYSATIDMPARTVTLDRNVTIESFSLSRGTLAGTNAPTLWLNQQLHLGAIKLTGEGLLSANGLTITGVTKVFQGWTLANRGIGNWLEGDLRVGNGFHLQIAPNSVFNVSFDGNIVNDLGGTALIENASTFRKSAGNNQTKISVPFLNTGTVEIDTGTLAFYGNSTNLAGKTEILPGATLQLTGLRHAFDSASRIYGAGNLLLDNGTVDFDGTANFTGQLTVGLGTLNLTPASTMTQLGTSAVFARSGTLNLNSGGPIVWNSLTQSNGVLSGSDAIHIGAGGFLWTGGTINGTGSLDLDGDSVFIGGYKTLRGRQVNNHGTVQWLAGDLSTGDGMRFVNLAGANLLAGYDGTWAISSGTARLDNYGAIQKTGGTNLTTFSIPFYNEGLVTTATGTIRFANTLTNQGGLSMQAGTALDFASANIQLTALGSLDGDGEVILNAGAITDSGSFRAGAGVTLKSGTLRFTNTTSRPNLGAKVQFNNSATLDLSSGYTVGIPLLIHTNGTITGSDTLVVSNLWLCANGDLDGTGRLELRGSSYVNGGPRWTGRRVVNYGDFDWAGGDIDGGLGLAFHNAPGGRMYVDGNNTFSGNYGGLVTFLNEGTINKSSTGTTLIMPPFVNNNGMVIGSAGRFQFSGGYTQTNGVLALNGAAIGSTKPFLIYAGTVAGSGDILGSLYTEGTLMPGWGNSIGCLSFAGSCTQAVSARLQIEIAGTNQFDRLVITNLASLNGSLEISLLPGYTPQLGDRFPIVTCGTRSGQFTEITGATLPGDLKLVPLYQPNGVTLIVVDAAAPPPTLTITPLPAAHAVQVSWPIDNADWTLQSCTNLATGNWSVVPGSGTNSVTVSVTQPAQFFRLKNPASPAL